MQIVCSKKCDSSPRMLFASFFPFEMLQAFEILMEMHSFFVAPHTRVEKESGEGTRRAARKSLFLFAFCKH